MKRTCSISATVLALIVAALLLGCATTGGNSEEMSNAALIGELYSRFGQGDVPGVLAMLSEDFEMVLPGDPDYIPWAGTFVGPDGFVDFLTKLTSTVEILSSVRGVFATQGDQVIVPYTDRKRVLANDNLFEFDGIAVWTVVDGVVVGARFYADSIAIAKGLLAM